EMCIRDRLEVASQKTTNCILLAKLIESFEIGIGVEKNELKASEWRKKLPEEWREAPIEDFFNHLKEINYTYDRTGYP
ncbi:MAG: hypothetical protein P0S93_05015, partial [Candidatus Neptunochlamydia sp.]|nr:hypothetical protein [Candidatus Neptunochlamydia sp.]